MSPARVQVATWRPREGTDPAWPLPLTLLYPPHPVSLHLTSQGQEPRACAHSRLPAGFLNTRLVPGTVPGTGGTSPVQTGTARRRMKRQNVK